MEQRKENQAVAAALRSGYMFIAFTYFYDIIIWHSNKTISSYRWHSSCGDISFTHQQPGEAAPTCVTYLLRCDPDDLN